MKEKRTPRTDALLAELKVLLEPRGRKADLARFLGGSNEQKNVSRWQDKIYRYLSGSEHPNGETSLAINEWIGSNRRTDK